MLERLFSIPGFDLFTGAWETRDATRLGISRWAAMRDMPLMGQ